MRRTFVNLENASIGFDPSGLVTSKVAVSRRAFSDENQLVALHRGAIDRVAQIPGVEAVAAGGPMPFDGYAFARNTEPDGALPFTARATFQSVFPDISEVAPNDVATLVSVVTVVAHVALIAASHPAWVAAKTDPCSALRAE